MSRWRRDPDAAADQLIERSLDALDRHGHSLLANASGRVQSLLLGSGFHVTPWNRRCETGITAQSWPPPGRFSQAIVRLAKAKDEQAMMMHAVLSRLVAGGRITLYGGNDEGIRSAASMLGELCGAVDVVAQRGHGRVISAARPDDISQLKSTLGQWRSVTELKIGGRDRQWVSYPGVFAAGRMDEGTTLLVSALPPLAAGMTILDFGCGSGIVGAALLATEPAIRLDMLDNDAVALEAARENVPSGRLIMADSLRQGGPASYDAILSNPPLHQGIAEDRRHLDGLVQDAPSHLNHGGVFQIVAQRQIGLHDSLSARFPEVAVAAENARFRVWRARLAD
jgi:16S rRNA (guanine1207-N2)-methyltransferase